MHASGRKPVRSMISDRLIPDSSRAVCPLLGRMTRCELGMTRTSRPDSSREGSSRSAALATMSVGALRVVIWSHIGCLEVLMTL